MKGWQIFIDDWQRILAGQVPAVFYIELVLRATFLFLMLIVAMRIMGKRMAAQLTRTELATLSALAASIGVPLLATDRGLLPSLIIAIVVVSISRLSAYINFRNQAFEKLAIGDLGILVKDGVLNAKEMQVCRLSREQLFSQLRSDEIVHLGEVKRMYFEASGDFSIVKDKKAAPGLLVLPSADEDFVKRMTLITDKVICLQCGKHQRQPVQDGVSKCDNCGENQFTKAVIAKS